VVTGHGEGAARRLAAYLVPADQAEGIPPGPELRAWLGARLPEFMIPAVFTELASLPLTRNGKVDQAALPAPDTARPALRGYVAPDTPAEELLAGIWAEVLGVDRVGVHDDFFELGGHSLLVIQAVARIKASGHDISVGDFYDHPTIAAAAGLIQALVEDPQTTSAVRIRSGTIRPAVFCAHGRGGLAAGLNELAAQLGPGEQLYGLTARGLTGDEAVLESVEEMAAAYLAEVLRVQPDGPYLFAGQSGAGYVAFEMARQMTAMGREMGGLFLIGPPVGPLPESRKRPLDRAERRLMREFDRAIAAGPGRRLGPEYEEQFLRLCQTLRVTPSDERVAAVRAGDQQELRAVRVWLTDILALQHYRGLLYRNAKPYDGRVVLFMPTDDRPQARQATIERWRSVLPREPEIVDVPGTHATVAKREGARFIGAVLSAEIARCR
jgi:thioesterase domain-containing protein/aryl carrier-like protein